MPSDFYQAVLDTRRANRTIQSMSMNDDGDWAIVADNWVRTKGTTSTFRRYLGSWINSDYDIDFVNFNSSGGYVRASNGSYTYDSSFIDQFESHPNLIGQNINIHDRMDNGGINGFSIAYYQGDALVAQRGYGVLDDQITNYNSERYVDTNTRFEFSSVSKTVATAGTLAYFGSGNSPINLSTTVSSVAAPNGVPDTSTCLGEWYDTGSLLNGATSFDTTLNVRHIMSHTDYLDAPSNFAHWNSRGSYKTNLAHPTCQDLLRGARQTDCDASDCSLTPDMDKYLWRQASTNVAGDVYEYQAGGMTILQVMLEHVSGTSFENLMDAYLLSRLDMVRSTFGSPQNERSSPNGNTMLQPPSAQGSSVQGVYATKYTAGLIATPADVGKVGLMIQNNGLPLTTSGASDRVLQTATVTDMLTRSSLNNGSTVNYGLGIKSRGNMGCLDANGVPWIVGHGGSGLEERSRLWINRQTGETVVFAVVADKSADAGSMRTDAESAIRAILGWSPTCSSNL